MALLDFLFGPRSTPADLVIAERARDVRSSPENPSTSLANPAAWLRDALGGAGSASGVAVTEEGSMRIAAVYACVRVLAESVSSLPLKLYRRTATGRDLARDHPLYSVVHHRGNAMMSAMQLREVIMVHLGLWGNAYCEIQRDGAGRVVGLWPIPPDKVTVTKNDADTPRLVYKVRGVERPFRQDEIFHVAGLGFNGVTGKSPIRLMRDGLGLARAAETYGAKFFANDARPGIALQHPGVLGDEAFNHLRDSWTAMHQGAGNAYKPAILEEGMTLATIGLPPDDAQFIETRKYQRGEIASIFRVPPHLIGDLERATFSNIEHQSLEFVMHSLRPWLVRIEQAILLQLVDEREQGDVYAEHSVDGLLRGDITSRYTAYATARQWGWLSVNDIRELENLNPVDGGGVYLQPLNMVPAGTDPFAGDGARSATVPATPPVLRLSLPAGETRALPSRYGEAHALRPTYENLIGRSVRREIREIREAVAEHLGGDEPNRQAFGDWLVAYADDLAERMGRQVLPAFRAMAEAMAAAATDEIGDAVSADELDAFVRDYVAAYAQRHAGSTRGQLLGIAEESEDPEADVSERLDEWEEGGDGTSRAETEAGREIVRSASALTKAAWAILGVSVISWRSVGKSCPYCDELDGRAVEITRSFLDAGDSVQDLTVGSRIGHPPVHKGCDCILMPGSQRAALPPSELRSLLADIAGDGAADTPACGHTTDGRNAYIRTQYDPLVKRHGRSVALTMLRDEIAAMSEARGWTPIGERQILRIARPGSES